MKYSKNLLEQLKELPYFDKTTIYSISKRNNMKKKTVDMYISRYLRSKEIISLGKRGTYVTANFYEKNRGDTSYKFFLTNILRKPSYISSWSALQYYELTTDVINTTISITTQITKTYNTKIGGFVYHSIKSDLFTDFYLVEGTYDFFIATPSKALFDLLYIKTNQFRGIKMDMVDAIIDELRIDIDEMEEKERKRFYKKINNFIA